MTASAVAYMPAPEARVDTNCSWKDVTRALSAWYSWPWLPNNAEIAADTSSCAAIATCVVELAAAALALLIADPIPVRFADAEAKISGAAKTYDDRATPIPGAGQQ